MDDVARIEQWEMSETRQIVVTLPSGAYYYIVQATVAYDEDLMILWTVRRREGNTITPYGSRTEKEDAVALAYHWADLETGRKKPSTMRYFREG